jgi:hypothetical protein
VTNLPLSDKSFDTTFCYDVLEHVDDAAALAELARVTRKRILVAVPRTDDVMAPYGLTFFHYRDTTHLRTYTEGSLAALAATVRPVAVNIFPELPVPTRELVRHMMTPDLHAARGWLENALREGGLAEEQVPEVEVTVDRTGEPLCPDIPVRGIRSRLKAWAARDPFVRDAFLVTYRQTIDAAYQDAYRHAYRDAYHAAYNAAFHATIHERFDADFNAFIVKLFDEATYETIYTGLVAVLDLA